MTSLRLRSAAARVDLVGGDRLPAAVLERVRGVSGHLETRPEDASPAYATVTVTGRDGGVLVAATPLPEDTDHAAALVVAALDRALLDASPCLTVHAAVLAGPQGAVVVPGVSGLGKSTLSGAGQRAGLLLVSDEAACVDPDADVVWPHPRPLGLDQRSRELLGLAPPDEGPPDVERATSPRLLGGIADPAVPIPLVAVVLADRSEPVAPAVLQPGSQTEGLAALLANCLNTGPDKTWTPERAWERLTALIPSVSVYSLRYASPQDGAAALASLVT